MKTVFIPAIALIASCLAFAAARADTAETLFVAPQYYEVKGVAAHDVLNIRSGPTGQAEIVGSLPPGAAPVEVIALTEGPSAWGKVIVQDGSGWVSMAYLAEIDPQRVAGTPVPVKTVCAGTEPFWSMTFTGDSLVFEAPDEAPVSLPLTGSGPFIARPHRFFAEAGDGATRLTAVISSGEYCSDGMSDRDYGWSVDLLRNGGGAISGYTGCCMRGLNE